MDSGDPGQNSLNDIIISKRFHFIYRNNEWHVWFDGGADVKFNNISSKISVTDKLVIQFGVAPNVVSSVIPKIHENQAKEFSIWRQNIFLNDFIFLASKCEKVQLNLSTVMNDDGTDVALEKLFEVLQNVKDFYCDNDVNIVTTTTVSELLKLPHFSNLNAFHLRDIPVSFDIERFYNYIKENKKTKFFLSFEDQLPEHYQNRLQAIVNEILAAENRDYKPPFIDFLGSDQTSRDNLWRLHNLS